MSKNFFMTKIISWAWICLLYSAPAVCAQKITEKDFIKNQHLYVKQVQVGEVIIRQKRVPESAFPTKTKNLRPMFFFELKSIQSNLDKLQEDFVAQKKKSTAWGKDLVFELKDIPERLKDLQKQENKWDIAPYQQEWEVYAKHFRKQDSIASAQFWQKINLEKQARQQKYNTFLQLCEKDLLAYSELRELAEGRKAFPDSVALRECYVLKLAQSGDVQLALKEEEPYMNTGTSTQRTRSRLFYERVKVMYVKPITSPTKTTTTTTKTTTTSPTRRKKTTTTTKSRR
jgi:hypothetical protein